MYFDGSRGRRSCFPDPCAEGGCTTHECEGTGSLLASLPQMALTCCLAVRMLEGCGVLLLCPWRCSGSVRVRFGELLPRVSARRGGNPPRMLTGAPEVCCRRVPQMALMLYLAVRMYQRAVGGIL